MSQLKRTWTFAGGLLLAAAALEVPVSAQDVDRGGRLLTPAGEPASLPGAGFSVARGSALPSADMVYGPDPGAYDCPPEELSGFQRWRMRHRAKKQDALCGYPEEFIRPPLGAVMHSHLEAQKTQGRVARMALYEYDFLPGTDELKPRGKTQLARILMLVPTTPGYIYIEPSRDGVDLDEARRMQVWRQLSGGPISIPLENIQTGTPVSRGLDGREAQLINLNRQRMLRTQGGSSGSSSGGTGSSTSSGSGN